METETQFRGRATKMQQRGKTQETFGESQRDARLTSDSPRDSHKQNEKL